MYPVRISGRTECDEASAAFNSFQSFPFPLTITLLGLIVSELGDHLTATLGWDKGLNVFHTSDQVWKSILHQCNLCMGVHTYLNVSKEIGRGSLTPEFTDILGWVLLLGGWFVSKLDIYSPKHWSKIKQRRSAMCFCIFSPNHPRMPSSTSAFSQIWSNRSLGKEDLCSNLHALYITWLPLMRRSDRIQGRLEEAIKICDPMNLIVREFVHFPFLKRMKCVVLSSTGSSTHSPNKTT